MQLCAVLARDELAAVIEQITPFEVEISRQPRRVISLGPPSKVELVPGAGLRLRGSARVTWDVVGLSLPVTLRRWQILLAPSVVRRGEAHVLAFDPMLEVLDLENVPSFVADRIAGAINEGLAVHRNRLVWNFTKTLSWRRGLPRRVSPPSRFEISPSGGTVEITPSELRLTVPMRARFVREESAPRPDTPSSSRSARP